MIMGSLAQRGVTLLEVLVVAVIIALLLSIGLPAYQASVHKGRRSDALTLLLDVATRQEQFMLQRSTYTTKLTDLGYASDITVSAEGHYRVLAAPCDGGDIAVCYRLTATPVPGGLQEGDSGCTSISLNSLGERGASGVPATRCW